MENFTNLSDRIRQIIDYKGISINKFSLQIGVSNSYFNKILRDNNSVGSDKIEKILREYPEINPEWLILGSGEMFKNNNTITQTTTGDNNISIGKGSIKGNNTINSNTGNETIKQLQKELEICKNQLEEYKKMLLGRDNQIDRLLGIFERKEDFVYNDEEIITKEQALQIREKIIEIGVTLALNKNISNHKAYAEEYAAFYKKFHISKYELLPKEKFNEAMKWLQGKYFTIHEETWRKNKYTAINTKYRQLGMTKEEFYIFANEALGLKKHFSSMTELSKTSLEKLYRKTMAKTKK